MVKISASEKQTQKVADEAKQEYITSFSSRFTVEKLKELYKSEESNKYKVIDEKRAKAEKELGENTVKQKIHLKEEDYEIIYPKCLKYIRDNIFRSDKGRMFYIISINDDGNLAPIEYTKEEMSDKLKFFPDEIRNWFEKIFCTEYRIDCDNTEKKVYIKNGINHLNIFNGYKFDGINIDDKIHAKRKDDIEFIWNHLFDVLCSGNKKIYEYIKQWICALIGGRRKMTTSWYMKGKRGVGKSKFVSLLMRIISEKNCFTVKHQNQIMNEFNGHFLAKVLVFIDDVEFTGQNFMSFGETMKTYITEKKIAFRDLFKTASQMTNITSWIIAGNQDVGALKDGNANERSRYVVSDLSPHLKPTHYFDRLVKLTEEDDEFLKAFYLDCIKNYNPNFNEQEEIKKLPITKTKEEQIQKTMPAVARMLKHYVVDEPNPEIFELMKFTDFYNIYFLEWHKQHNTRDKKIIEKHALFNELNTSSYASIKQRRIKDIPTKNTILIEKDKLMKEFIKNKYIVQSDDIDIDFEKYTNDNNELEDLDKEERELMQKLKEIETKRLELLNKIFTKPTTPTTSVKPIKKTKRIIPVSTFDEHVKDCDDVDEFDIDAYFN